MPALSSWWDALDHAILGRPSFADYLASRLLDAMSEYVSEQARRFDLEARCRDRREDGPPVRFQMGDCPL
jgi:hypothetical protein